MTRYRAHRPESLVVDRGRRRFLIGSGAVLALPFLETLTSRTAHAWAPVAGGPSRMAVVYNSHGLIMENFLPGPNFSMRPILQPVADANLTSKLLIVGGVDQKVNSAHAGNAWTHFTCVPKTEWGSENWQITGSGPSIEHVIGRHMADGQTPRRLDVGVYDDLARPTQRSNLFWFGADDPVVHQLDPQRVFDGLFASEPTEPETETSTRTTVNRRDSRRALVLDRVLEQFRSLRGRVSADDRHRLDQHAEKLVELEQSLVPTTTEEVPVELSPTCDEPPAVSPLSGLTHREVAERNIDILSHALACNLVDIGTFRIFDLSRAALSFITDPSLNAAFGDKNHHNTWHDASDLGVELTREAFTLINTWYGELFARLLQNLDAIDEGDGTALDHTMVLWTAEYGHGGGHASGNLPVVFAGNAGGATLGRYVNLSRNGADSQWRNDANPGFHACAVTCMNAFGITGNTFGDYANVESPVASGPLAL